MVATSKQPATVRNPSGWLATILLGSVLVGTCGCSMEQDFWKTDTTAPCAGEVKEPIVMWQDHVCWSSDTLRNGQPVPVLSGRLYLVGSDSRGRFVKADGTVTVELYDNSEPGALLGKPPKYRWSIDKATMPKLLQKDRLGWGYTMLLPLWEYHPDLNRVWVKVGYGADHAAPLFDAGAFVTLNKDSDMRTANKTVPGGYSLRSELTGTIPGPGQQASVTQVSYNTAAARNVPPAPPQRAIRTVIPVPAPSARPAPPPPPQAQPENAADMGTITPVGAPTQFENTDWRAAETAAQPVRYTTSNPTADGTSSALLPANVPASATLVTIVQPPAPTGGLRRLVIPGGGTGIQQQNIWPPQPGQ